ncbi:hypothetical protein [Persephonella sp.]
MKVNDEVLIQVKRYIEERGKPLFFENEFGRFALVLTEKGKKKFLNKGYIAITLNELRNLIKECRSFKQQKEKITEVCRAMSEGFGSAVSIKNMFDGKITNLGVCHDGFGKGVETENNKKRGTGDGVD